jgi:hypothetical protein
MGWMQWTRDQYKVPAYRGRVVEFRGERGRILSARQGHLRLRMDDGRNVIVHPTLQMNYRPAGEQP